MKKIGVILMSLLLLVTFSSALSISGDNELSLCQCETQKLEYEFCGTGEAVMNVSGQSSDWVSIAPQNISLEDSCEKVYAFVTPPCYATSGTFPFEINVIGEETISQNVNLYVEQCHTFNYSVTPANNTSIPCQNNNYDITVENTGKFSDEFVLLQSGLNDSWTEYPEDSFILTPGETIQTQLIVNTPCDIKSGEHIFELNLSNTQTNASQTKVLTQNISSYDSINTTIPSEIEACSMYGTQKEFYVTNTSDKNDVFNIDLQASEYVSINTNELSIPAGETKGFTLNISPADPQSEFIKLTVHSQKFDKNYDFSVASTIKNCYDFEIVRKEKNTNYCIGENTETFVVSNKGTQELILDVNINGITEQLKTINVQPQETKEVAFDYTSTENTKQVNVLADATHLQKGISYSLNFENCYGTNVTVPTLNIYPGTVINETITVQNNGTKNQEYELSVNADWINLDSNKISVNSGEEKSINMVLNVPSKELRDNYELNVVSENIIISKVMPANILSKEEAYSIDYSTKKNVDVNCCQGKIVDLNITNNSLFNQTIIIEKIAPEWVSFNVDEIELGREETKTVFVYFSPPAGTNGILKSQILLTNQENIIEKVDYNLDVFGGNCGVALQIDLNLDNKLTDTKEFTRKDFTVEFIVKNDSNVGFNVLDINVPDFNSSVDFNNGAYLQPNQQLKAGLTISLPENYDSNIVDMNVIVMTSVGDFVKKQTVDLSSDTNKPQEIPISGFFGEFIVQFSGILLLLIILVIIIIVATRPSQESKEENVKSENKKKGKKKK